MSRPGRDRNELKGSTRRQRLGFRATSLIRMPGGSGCGLRATRLIVASGGRGWGLSATRLIVASGGSGCGLSATRLIVASAGSGCGAWVPVLVGVALAVDPANALIARYIDPEGQTLLWWIGMGMILTGVVAAAESDADGPTWATAFVGPLPLATASLRSEQVATPTA
jgi:hypothetical protein